MRKPPPAANPFAELLTGAPAAPAATSSHARRSAAPRPPRPESSRLHVLLPHPLVPKLKTLARERQVPLSHFVAELVEHAVAAAEAARGKPLPLYRGSLPPGRQLT